MYINLVHKKMVEDRGYEYIGSYKTKETTLDGKNKNGKKAYIRVKCFYCGKEYDIRHDNFKEGQNCTYCCNRYENSFAYHIQVELGESLNKYWDWEKNTVNPYLISKNRNSKNRKGENTKVWLKCSKKDYHGSYEGICSTFVKGDRCPYCTTRRGKVHPKESFAQYHIDNTDKNFIKKYWSDKNTLNPWEITPSCHKNIWIKCQYGHEDYLVNAEKFHAGQRCGLCQNSKGELKIKEILNKFNIEYKKQIKFDDLLGLGSKKLSYDFYLPDYNMLIEFQGRQHEKYIKGFHKNKDEFKKQLEHDRRKFKYAMDNKIDILYLYHWEYDEIEYILKYELQLEG